MKPWSSMRSSAWAGVSASSSFGSPASRDPGLDLEVCARTRRQRANGPDCAAGDEERFLPAWLDRRRDQAELEPAQALQPAQALDDVLEGVDPVSQAGRLLVAQALGEIREPCSKARQRAALVEPLELLRGARSERARCQRRPATARDRPQRAWLLRDHELLASPTQVQPVLLPAPARVGRRLELPDQAQLLECRLELGTEDSPLDALEREQGRFDRGPLALAPEVGAQTGAEVAGSPDVQHLVVAVAKQVDAGPRRRSVGKRALGMDPALARCRELS